MIRTGSDLLEFELLRQLLGRHVSSALGRAELDEIEPVVDRAWIEAQKAGSAGAGH